MIDDVGPEQGLRCLSDNGLPVSLLRCGQIQRDDFAARCFKIGEEPEARAFTGDVAVIGIESGQKRHRFGLRVRQVDVVDLFQGSGAAVGRDNEIAVILGHSHREIQFSEIGPVINKGILFLALAQLVEIDLLILVAALVLIGGIGFIVAAVVEAAAILAPDGAREFHPADMVRGILAGLDIAHAPLLPV